MNAMAKTAIVLGHALVGWALCGATMWIGMGVTTVATAILIHAVAAPLFFALISAAYFKWFHYTTPLQTASIFVGFVVVVDLLVVALLIEKSFAMFESITGTWLVFGLIFASTLLTGVSMEKRLRV
jgi:hypothetical protein